MHRTFCKETYWGRDHFGDLGVEGRIIFKWILKKKPVGSG
jgi:hypothetical protein